MSATHRGSMCSSVSMSHLRESVPRRGIIRSKLYFIGRGVLFCSQIMIFLWFSQRWNGGYIKVVFYLEFVFYFLYLYHFCVFRVSLFFM